MKKPGQFLFRSLVGLVLIAGIFIAYNYFLIDVSLERIRTALTNVSQANSLSDSESVSFLFQDLLVNEIIKPDADLEHLAATDAFQSTLELPESQRQKSDVQFLLQNLLSSYQKKRSPLLNFLDQLNQLVIDQFFRVIKFAKFIFFQSRVDVIKEQTAEEMRYELLSKARESELKWKFDESAKAYQLFIERYPEDPKVDFVKLNLASVDMRSGRYEMANKILSEIRLTFATPDEIRLVSLFKDKLNELEKISASRKQLSQEIKHLREAEGKLKIEEKDQEKNEGPGIVSHLRAKEPKSSSAVFLDKMFLLGIYYVHLYDLDNAKKTFQEVIGRKPPPEMEKQAKWILAWIHLLQSNYQESRRLMKELLERFPMGRDHSLNTYALATLAERSGDYEDAAGKYETLAKESNSKDASFLFKYRAGGVYLYYLQDIKRAQNAFREAGQLITTPFLSDLFEQQISPQIQSNLRDAAFQKFLQGDTETAKKFFEDMLRLNPNDAWGYCGFGLVLYMDGEKEAGMDYVTHCRALKRDEYTCSALAYLMEREGQMESAMIAYDEAIQIRPGYIVALYNMAYLYIKNNQLEEALSDLTEAKKHAGAFSQYLPLISNNLGIVLWRLGRNEEAKTEFQNALIQDPEFLDARFNLEKIKELSSNQPAEASPKAVKP